MFVNIVYDIPNLLLGLIIVGGIVLIAVVGYVVVRKCVSEDKRHINNIITSALSQMSGVFFAVVAGFIAIDTWGAFDKALKTVTEETNAAYDVWLNSRIYPKDFEMKVREGVESYLNLVIHDEWPLQRQGEISERATYSVENLYRLLIDFVPETVVQQHIHSETIHDLNAMIDARRDRLFINSHGLEPSVYYMIFLSALSILAFTWCFGSKYPAGHFVMTAMLGIGVGLVLFVILIFDYPFRGKVAVSTKTYEDALEQMQRLKIDQPSPR